MKKMIASAICENVEKNIIMPAMNQIFILMYRNIWLERIYGEYVRKSHPHQTFNLFLRQNSSGVTIWKHPTKTVQALVGYLRIVTPVTTKKNSFKKKERGNRRQLISIIYKWCFLSLLLLLSSWWCFVHVYYKKV
jgi:hypothetical protein